MVEASSLLYLQAAERVDRDCLTDTMAARYYFLNNNLSLPRRTNIYRRRGECPLEVLPDEEVIKEFRMTKSEIEDLCDLLGEYLAAKGCRECDLSVKDKVLIALKTLASGSFQNYLDTYYCSITGQYKHTFFTTVMLQQWAVNNYVILTNFHIERKLVNYAH